MPSRSVQQSSSGPDDDPKPGRLDLNLLEVFDIVMTERHVTRAAVRLGMTQSAVSNALNRLRRRFHDQLFVKTARGMDPTPKAVALWPRLHQAMEDLRDTVEPAAFNPEAVKRFRIALADITAALITPHLYREVQTGASGVKLHFVPHVGSETGPRLMRGDLDFALVTEPPPASVVHSMPLWSDNVVVTARRGHPLLEGRLSLADFCSAPQIVVNQSGDEESGNRVERALADRGLERNVCLSVNQFLAVPGILKSSDLIAVLPCRFAASPTVRDGTAFVPLPFMLPDVVVHLCLHQRSALAPSTLWLKQRLLAAATAFRMETDEFLLGRPKPRTGG